MRAAATDTNTLALLLYVLLIMDFSISSRITLQNFVTSCSSVPCNVATAIQALCDASIEIQELIRFPTSSSSSSSLSSSFSSLATMNASGEKQKPLDILSDSIIMNALKKCPSVSIYASEELDNAIVLNPFQTTTCEISSSSIAVLCDPLDGSSNIDCNIPTGTIFTIVSLDSHGECNALTDLLLERKQQIQQSSLSSSLSKTSPGIGASILAAGYILYSGSTELVLNSYQGGGVQGFTLDPRCNEYILTRPSIKCPPRGPYYSLNEGKSDDWPSGLLNYIADIKAGRGTWGKRYGIRYVCSLVADIHRTLLYGGWAGNPRAHLRLLFESATMATLLKEADGMATEGKINILDVVPTKIHTRLPLFAGSRDDILEIMARGDCAQL